MFPVQHIHRELDERGLFLCDDLELRSKILPLFSFDPQRSDNRPKGHGTTFRIDPWSRCATAFHVLEELFEPFYKDGKVVLRGDIGLAALEVNGFAYGTVPLAENAWRPVTESFSISGVQSIPLTPNRIRNYTELAVLRIRPSEIGGNGTPFLPVDLRRWCPDVGEQVMALGYANLDAADRSDSDDRPIRQYIYGSLANITEVETANFASWRPWPRIRVDVEWPGGMSGGPVFNQHGHVIGVVSAGFDGQSLSTAVIFSGWNLPAKIFGSIDSNNPGMFYCFGVFDENDSLVYAGQNQMECEDFARENEFTDIATVSIDPLTDDYVRL